jgi:hypothetical protein
VPTPYKQQIHDQLWLLLEAHAPLVALVTAGKELKQTGDGWLRDRLLRGAGDFPQVAIDGGRFNLSGFTIGKTFADEEPSASLADVADMPIRRRCEFTITITGRGLKSTDVDPTEEETQVAILKGGPRLGLPAFVLEWGPIEARQQWVDEGGNATRKRTAVRLQSVMTLPIIIEVPAATLTG